MPALIEHIDAIARRHQRDALYLEFHPRDAWRGYRYNDDAMRSAILDWLAQHHIAWQPCGAYAQPDAMWPYLGQIYVDVPFDASLATYCTLRDYLELPDGSMRHAGVRFYVMPLDFANQNAAHDAPGFWEDRAQHF